MRTDKKSVEDQLSAIETLKLEFLKFSNYSEMPSPDELKARHEKINEALSNCGGSMDAYWVSGLFYELEQKAIDDARKFVFLAQTTEPDELKDKYFNDLPQKLVDNVKTIQKHLVKTNSRAGIDVINKNKDLRLEEIVYRANWLLDNPEPNYKGRKEAYRSSTLSVYIRNSWATRTRIDPSGKNFRVNEPWENNNFPESPSIRTIQRDIKLAVNKGKLDKFLLSGKPKTK